MWSHYSDSYTGMVIGIDTEKAGLEDGETFIIPSTKGEVRYLKTVPSNMNKASVESLMSVWDANRLNWDNMESLLKHRLLYKMQEWAYEEEVRVVKNISHANFMYHHSDTKEAIVDDQLWTRVQLPTRPIYTLKIPQDAIVEVCIGQNCYIDQRRKYENSGSRIQNHLVPSFEKLKQWCAVHNINLCVVKRHVENWSLIKHTVI